MKTYKEFENTMVRIEKNMWSDAGYTVEVIHIPSKKNHFALAVGHADSQKKACLDLTDGYNQMQATGNDFTEKELMDLLEEFHDIVLSKSVNSAEEDFKNFLNIDYIKKHVFTRLRNVNSFTSSRLKRMVHKQFTDLVLTYHIEVSNEDDILSNFPVTYDVLKELKLLEKEFLEMADSCIEKNNPVVFFELPAFQFAKDILITNQQKLNGASALFYSGILEKLSAKFPNGFCILPSSIHELIVTDMYDENINMLSVKNLQNSICSINEKCCDKDEVLSTHPYFYIPESQHLISWSTTSREECLLPMHKKNEK